MSPKTGPDEAFIVPRFDPRPAIRETQEDIEAAIARVVRSGRFIGGEEVVSFEKEVADFVGASFAVSTGSGTDALTIALMAVCRSLPANARIVTNPLSYIATASAIVRARCEPIFADVKEGTFLIDVEKLAEGPRNFDAIVSVDLYGRMASVAQLERALPSVPIIEDCCQSFGATNDTGARAGTQALAGAYSFFPSKPLGAFGDGGLLVTNCPDIAAFAELVKRHGMREQYIAEMIGFNSRLDAIHAAVLRRQLKCVDARTRQRRQTAEIYIAGLSGLDNVTLPDLDPKGAWHAFPVTTTRKGLRDKVLHGLRRRRIEAVAMYPVPIHKMSPFRTDQRLPVAEFLAANTLTLPIWSGMTQEQIEHTVESCREVVREAACDGND